MVRLRLTILRTILPALALVTGGPGSEVEGSQTIHNTKITID